MVQAAIVVWEQNGTQVLTIGALLSVCSLQGTAPMVLGFVGVHSAVTWLISEPIISTPMVGSALAAVGFENMHTLGAGLI